MAETILKPIENKSKPDKTQNGKAATFAIRGPLCLRSVMPRENAGEKLSYVIWSDTGSVAHWMMPWQQW